MSKLRLLLCTDMDRTVIPNGSQPEHPEARSLFRRLCRLSGVELVYVTGRHLQLVEEAIAEYDLPLPGYVIADVGTKIYQRTTTGYTELQLWQQEIAGDWQGKSQAELWQILASVASLTPQEESKQSDFKLSYYLPLQADVAGVTAEVEAKLDEAGVAASVITSIDEPAQVGLLDVLPRNATKLHGLNFLREYCGYAQEETIFAGDSGNDLPVLESDIRSVLVANADPALQKQAAILASQNGNSSAFYQAQNTTFYLGGNYCAGVVQGVVYYMPHIMELLG